MLIALAAEDTPLDAAEWIGDTVRHVRKASNHTTKVSTGSNEKGVRYKKFSFRLSYLSILDKRKTRKPSNDEEKPPR
jgi:hypothetical protein